MSRQGVEEPTPAHLIIKETLTMICHSCGTVNVRTARVCATCGAVLTVVGKAQFAYETAVLPESAAHRRLRKSKAMSLASLILGLVALTPATFITGIPAIILSAIALKRRRPGRAMAYVGFVTGAFGTLILTFALLLPLIARQREFGREAAVKRNMRAFQAAFVDYATDHDGRYPQLGISWEPEDEDGMLLHFKGPNGLVAGIPFNPYTGERYHRGRDFFYQPDYLADAGLNAIIDRSDARSPFVGLAARSDVPGTIMILGWSSPAFRDSPLEYAIVGYGRNTAEPLVGRTRRVFFILYN